MKRQKITNETTNKLQKTQLIDCEQKSFNFEGHT